MLERLRKGKKDISKQWLIIASALYSGFTFFLTFVSWDDLGISQVGIKSAILAGILVIALLASVIWVCFLKSTKLIWSCGARRIVVCYRDILDVAFKKKRLGKRIVVIPVETTFDTVVDEDLTAHQCPRVSLKSIHGQWIKRMSDQKISPASLDSMIDADIAAQQLTPIKTLSSAERPWGKPNFYQLGTIVQVPLAKKDVTFYLLAIADFDNNNVAHSSPDTIKACIEKLMDFYSNKAQGYDLYIPLMGTGLAKANLGHTASLQLIKSELLSCSDKVTGKVNIAIYPGDKGKVSITD